MGIDFDHLNSELNDRIADFSMGLLKACAIGLESGVACTAGFDDKLRVIPEPDAKYIALSDVGKSNSVCAIQVDNRAVCWGDEMGPRDEIPAEALYLKQFEVLDGYACGVDLSDALVCWGYELELTDESGADVDMNSIGNVKQISLDQDGACVLNMDDTLECFTTPGRFSSFPVARFSALYAGKTFKSIDLTDYNSEASLCYEDLSGIKTCEMVVPPFYNLVCRV